MLLIGVDEAGYGPLLGPLAVAGSAFRVEGAGGRLDEALRARDDLVEVGDSKEVYGRGGLRSLERTVLAFLAASGGSAPSLDDLLEGVGVDPQERQGRPWYAGEPGRFPVDSPWDELGGLGGALRSGLASDEVRFLGFAADVIPETRLNHQFEETRNKADTLFDASAGVFERLLALRQPGEPVEVIFDRQGGRKRYLPLLQRRWPTDFAWTLAEAPRRSSYRLQSAGGEVAMSFVVEGDREAPQVGLASMLAKYLRELYMGLWNGWFGRLCPGVKPTAGYRQDGWRWLAESRGPRREAGIPDSDLVRLR